MTSVGVVEAEWAPAVAALSCALLPCELVSSPVRGAWGAADEREGESLLGGGGGEMG